MVKIQTHLLLYTTLKENDEQVDNDKPTIDLRRVPNTPSGPKRTSSESQEQTD